MLQEGLSSSNKISCEGCPQVKDLCSKCGKTVIDLIEIREPCKEESCDSSINLQYNLIEESGIDPLSWILSYAERFRDLWNMGVIDQKEMKLKLYS